MRHPETSFDHFVGKGEDVGRRFDIQSLHGRKVEHEITLGRLHGGFSPFKNGPRCSDDIALQGPVHRSPFHPRAEILAIHTLSEFDGEQPR
jgi:hypothetical protein